MNRKYFTKHLIQFFIKPLKTQGKPFIVLLILIAIYIIFFTFVTFEKHELFLTGRYDLGNMDQTVWNTLHGRIFVFTNPDFNIVLSRLSVHSDFILVLLAPFYLLWGSPRMLLLIQTVVIAFGAFFIYVLGVEVFKKKPLALAFAVSYLLNPYVQEQNMFDFHAVSLATTFLLAAFYFLYKNRLAGFFIFAFLAVLTKEEIFVVVGLMGLYIFFSKKKLWGILLSAVCFVLFYLIVAIFIPDARKGAHFALTYYEDLGGTPREVILTFFTHPFKIVTTLWHHDVLSYVKYLFMPVGYLLLFSPFAFIFAAPDFFINMLSNNNAFRSYYYHYAAAILPFIYIGAIFGAKRFLTFLPKKHFALILALYVAAAAVFSAWYFGPLPGSKQPNLDIFEPTGEEAEVSAYLKTIPRSESVAASNNIAAHLAHREKIYSLPSGVSKANLVMFYFSKNENPAMRNTDLKLVQALMSDTKFQIVYQLEDFIVFQRVASL